MLFSHTASYNADTTHLTLFRSPLYPSNELSTFQPNNISAARDLTFFKLSAFGVTKEAIVSGMTPIPGHLSNVNNLTSHVFFVRISVPRNSSILISEFISSVRSVKNSGISLNLKNGALVTQTSDLSAILSI